MPSDYASHDYTAIKSLMTYPETLDQHLRFFEDTSQISVPDDPIEKVVFQTRAKDAVRKIAQNKGHVLMVGRPGTGKSMIANMFNEVLDKSMGDYLRPRHSIIAYPGKDSNHIRIAYENPRHIDEHISKIHASIEAARESIGEFSLSEQIHSVRSVKWGLLALACASAVAGLFFPPAFILTGLAGIGAIFMYMQENNHRAQEKIQRENLIGKRNEMKHVQDRVPEVLYDPTKDKDLMARISEPSARNMKGGFRHDPYQSGNLHTPAHKRAFLGAHAKAPIIYIDELKTLIKTGYMSDLLEIMQNKKFVLEGGRSTGSGSADRSEDSLRADNIIIACCNHDTLTYLKEEGDGAFLSRIEDRGEVIQMESAVPETAENIAQVATYIKQETLNLGREFERAWGEILKKEGHEGVRARCQRIIGRPLPDDYRLEQRDFSRGAVLEIIKELRSRASDRKLSAILRPINGIIKTAEFEAILDNSALVEAFHVRRALDSHMSLEGAVSKEIFESRKDLKQYIGSMTDAIGYVVGLAVVQSGSSGEMHGLPLPIHCQINAGAADTMAAPGNLGDIAKAAAQNVRASIKKVFDEVGAPYVGYEMHVEYIQAHGGIEGDSASIAMDIALISDYLKQPVNQKFGVTGSLTGEIILAVGGVTEKIRSIMDPSLGMEGACIPWQNRHDVEPLLINTDYEYIQESDIPGIRIFREEGKSHPFDIYFCKTKYNAYKIVMGLDREEMKARMAERSKRDWQSSQSMKHH
ncbi:MAG: ATP-binding protein [Deltaproteobacteria bacterium]|nr:ATP-binding protein [Deltaproteobacteria bacterium]